MAKCVKVQRLRRPNGGFICREFERVFDGRLENRAMTQCARAARALSNTLTRGSMERKLSLIEQSMGQKAQPPKLGPLVTALCEATDAAIIEFRISAKGFLRYMVRSIVGTLLEVGRGEKDSDTIQTAIVTRDRDLAGKTASPHGLTLLKVDYD